MKYIIVILLFAFPLSSFGQPSHEDFDLMLKKYVDNKGGVNYEAFKNEESALNDYLIEMMLEPPTRDWSDKEKLAYWINVYNALTIQLILKYYPVSSIKDIGSKIQIPYINTPWDIKCFEINDGEELSLNNIEHGIIRKEFEEPRIHFALVCAAKSCPKLLNEAYDPTQLDVQLSKQTKDFLANTDKNKISADRLELSKIFTWYGGDFRKSGTLINYLNLYSPAKINEEAKTSFLDYDWSLNEQ